MTGANPLKVQRLGKLTGGEVCVCVGNCTLDGGERGRGDQITLKAFYESYSHLD